MAAPLNIETLTLAVNMLTNYDPNECLTSPKQFHFDLLCNHDSSNQCMHALLITFLCAQLFQACLSHGYTAMKNMSILNFVLRALIVYQWLIQKLWSGGD